MEMFCKRMRGRVGSFSDNSTKLCETGNDDNWKDNCTVVVIQLNIT